VGITRRQAMKIIRTYIVFFSICLVCSFCKSKPKESVDGIKLYNEISRINVQSFKDAVDLGGPTGYLVNIEKVKGLEEKIKKEIGYCYIYGNLDDPDGIYFIAKSGNYYISLKTDKVPWQIQNYEREKLADNVYKVYRNN
jgi:hypothetical protein